MKPIKASGSLVRDYWILEDGILRIDIVSSKLVSALILSVDIACAVLGVFVFRAFAPYYYLVAIVWSFTVFFLFRSKAARLRARFAEVLLSELVSNRAKTTLFPWTQISNFRIIGRTVEFQALGQRHDARIERADLSVARELAESKLGREVPGGSVLT